MKSTILLIDSDANRASEIEEILVGAGFELLLAASGEEGIKAFFRARPALVIIEAMLANENGIDLCRRLKSTDTGQQTPVILKSDSLEGEALASALEHSGCSLYLEAPVSDEQWLDSCGQLMPTVQSAGAHTKDELVEALEQFDSIMTETRSTREAVAEEIQGELHQLAEHHLEAEPKKATPLPVFDEQEIDELTATLDDAAATVDPPTLQAQQAPKGPVAEPHAAETAVPDAVVPDAAAQADLEAQIESVLDGESSPRLEHPEPPAQPELHAPNEAGELNRLDSVSRTEAPFTSGSHEATNPATEQAFVGIDSSELTSKPAETVPTPDPAPSTEVSKPPLPLAAAVEETTAPIPVETQLPLAPAPADPLALEALAAEPVAVQASTIAHPVPETLDAPKRRWGWWVAGLLIVIGVIAAVVLLLPELLRRELSRGLESADQRTDTSPTSSWSQPDTTPLAQAPVRHPADATELSAPPVEASTDAAVATLGSTTAANNAGDTDGASKATSTIADSSSDRGSRAAPTTAPTQTPHASQPSSKTGLFETLTPTTRSSASQQPGTAEPKREAKKTNRFATKTPLRSTPQATPSASTPPASATPVTTKTDNFATKTPLRETHTPAPSASTSAATPRGSTAPKTDGFATKTPQQTAPTPQASTPPKTDSFATKTPPQAQAKPTAAKPTAQANKTDQFDSAPPAARASQPTTSKPAASPSVGQAPAKAEDNSVFPKATKVTSTAPPPAAPKVTTTGVFPGGNPADDSGSPNPSTTVALPEVTPPKAISPIEPSYAPQDAKGGPHTVVLRVLVGERGSVVRVVVQEGRPGSPLVAASIDAVLRTRYRPAQQDGRPTRAWVNETFTFPR